MAPERASHAIVKGNMFVCLRSAIDARGPACRAFPDGMAVKVDDHTVYEPDTLVRCGPDLPGDAVELNDPLVVVEVISPSSRGVDRGARLASYFTLPSVRHYLIVDTDKRVIIHHHRDDTGRIGSQIVRDCPLTLDPPGLAIDTRDAFDGL